MLNLRLHRAIVLETDAQTAGASLERYTVRGIILHSIADMDHADVRCQVYGL